MYSTNEAWLYLYHNLPILQIHNYISYQIGRTIPIPIFMAGCINLHDNIVS